MDPSVPASCTWVGTMFLCIAGDSHRCSEALRSISAKRCERRAATTRRKMAWNVNSHLLTPNLYKKCAVSQANLIFSDANQSSARQSSGWRVQLLIADPTMKDSSFPGLSGWDFADYRSLISPAATSLCRMQRERCG